MLIDSHPVHILPMVGDTNNPPVHTVFPVVIYLMTNRRKYKEEREKERETKTKNHE